MPLADLNERFSRQVILPGVGVEGQQKWADATFLIAGEGISLQAASTAFETAGASKVILLDPASADPLPESTMTLVLTQDAGFRRQLSRWMRSQSRPVLYAWPSGSGFALFLATHRNGQCPCFECFEIMNPKAFNQGTPEVQRLLGAMAVSEILQWILKQDSPLAGKVWITALDSGVSFYHEVSPAYKCPARLLEEGAKITP
jgi:molybdopterin/thiamine biosynthesis adenylyltransferase